MFISDIRNLQVVEVVFKRQKCSWMDAISLTSHCCTMCKAPVMYSGTSLLQISGVQM
ncbi:hypothetical protein BT63DRAFT_93221 [Microthyrium microscopicum]|uniref:Uncharacterized protein n=1 Tax=Microthyrium microscopicum TaxID=703497 RepID=A0A6A6TZI7_9PEZI|nr:hypothetical protein BT63DRAFT_93221 [Microthyrium microscopicum]